MKNKSNQYRYHTMWKEVNVCPSNKTVNNVESFCSKLSRYDLQHEMRLRLKGREDYKEFQDSEHEHEGNSGGDSNEELIAEAEDFLDLRRRLKHKNAMKKVKDEGIDLPKEVISKKIINKPQKPKYVEDIREESVSDKAKVDKGYKYIRRWSKYDIQM